MEKQRQYRIEPIFLELIKEIGAQYLVIRQVGDDAYIVVAEQLETKTDFILAPARRPHEPRVFTDFGRAVKFAVNTFGLKVMHLDLHEGEGAGPANP